MTTPLLRAAVLETLSHQIDRRRRRCERALDELEAAQVRVRREREALLRAVSTLETALRHYGAEIDGTGCVSLDSGA